jgi:hypothetical protein
VIEGLVSQPREGDPARVIDAPTLQGWIEKLDFEVTPEEPSTLRIRPREGGEALPPFIVQCTENWVLLSILPLLAAEAFRAEGVARRLLEANRDMRLAKFALDKNGALVLCAELPTESLDETEIADAVGRMVHYAHQFLETLAERS